MATRITTLNIDVLVQSSSIWNASQVDTMSLVSTFDRSVAFASVVADTMSLTDSLGGLADRPRSADDTLSLTDAFGCSGTLLASVTDAFSLVDSLDGSADRSVTDALDFADAFAQLIIRAESESDTLVLADDYTESVIYQRSVSDTLSLTDTYEGRLATGVHESVTLEDEFDATPCWARGINDTLVLDEDWTFAGPRYKTVAESLTLADTFHKCQQFTGTLSNTLALTDTFQGNLHVASVAELLPLQDAFDTTGHLRTIQDTLVFSDGFSVPVYHNVAQVLALTDTFRATLTVSAFADNLSFAESYHVSPVRSAFIDSLALADGFRSSILSGVVHDTLSLVEALGTIGPRYAALVDALQSVTYVVDIDNMQAVATLVGLSDTFSAGLGVRQIARRMSESLGLDDSFGLTRIQANAKDVAFADQLSFEDEFWKAHERVTVDLLNVSDEFTAEVCRQISDTLVIAESYGLNIWGNRPTTDRLTFNDCLLAVIESGINLQQYHPFVSPNAVGAPPLALTGPLPGITAPFQLVYPASGTVIDSVVLRAQTWGTRTASASTEFCVRRAAGRLWSMLIRSGRRCRRFR